MKSVVRSKCAAAALVGAALAVVMTASAMAQDNADASSLADQARDPTAPVTAFQMTYKYVASFHQLPDASQGAILLQPIIPWKLGTSSHIARVSASYVTSGPDFGAIAETPPDLAPPNQIALGNQTGLQDIALLDLAIWPTSFGRMGLGGVISIPIASDPSLGSEKWSVGPAFVLMTKLGGFQGGFLLQGLFSVAGNEERADVDVLTLQPFGGIGLANNWSVGLSDIVFTYDTRRGKWVSVPFGLRLEKFVTLGSQSARAYVDAEYGFLRDEISPEWTYRFTFSPLLGGKKK